MGLSVSRILYGSAQAGTSRERSQLHRVLREAPVLDTLPDGDKASLAATCWGALETVLRHTRAVLKVHPDDPVLAGVAQRVTAGPCAGAVELQGVRVVATDAGALLDAAREVGFDLPLKIDVDESRNTIEHAREEASSEKEMLLWVEMMRALAATPGGAHVTGLTVPALSGNSWDLWTHLTSEAELQGVARVLQTRTVRDRLRFLKIAVGRDALMQHRAAEVLHGALGGLSALQHLQLDHPSAHLANVVDQLSGLRTLEVRQGLWMHDRGFTAAEWSAFWVALERATDLRSLTLSDWADRDASAELRALPARLEVLCMNCEHPLRWWDGINLRSLNLERMGHFERWDRLAELLSRSRKLTRLRVGGISDRPHIDPDAVLAVFSALEHSQVEDLSLACSFEAEGAFREALGAAVASAVRNMPALQELHLSGPTTREADPDGWLGFDRSAAVAALRDTATLRTLRLDLCSSKIEPGLGAALGGLVSRSTSLAELHLHRFECPAGSYSELFQGLGENRTLQVLRCCSGGEAPLDNGFVRRLMDALYGGGRHEGRQLHTLEIRSSRVRHAGVAHIAQVLEDRPSVKLRRLTLEGVDVGLESIGFALQRNCALVSLRVPVNEDRIYREVATLEEALVDNTTLRHLDIRELEGGSLYSTNVGKQLREVWHAQRFAMALREAIGGKPNRTPGEYFMRMMAR